MELLTTKDASILSIVIPSDKVSKEKRQEMLDHASPNGKKIGLYLLGWSTEPLDESLRETTEKIGKWLNAPLPVS
jgi:hypothetical protein